jgi:hypothetical protein
MISLRAGRGGSLAPNRGPQAPARSGRTAHCEAAPRESRHARRPPIPQRPSDSVASDAFAVPAKAEKPKGALQPRRCDCSMRYEQPLDPLEPKAGVAHPLVDFGPRHGSAPHVRSRHGALQSAHAPGLSRGRRYSNMAPGLRRRVNRVTFLTIC